MVHVLLADVKNAKMTILARTHSFLNAILRTFHAENALLIKNAQPNKLTTLFVIWGMEHVRKCALQITLMLYVLQRLLGVSAMSGSLVRIHYVALHVYFAFINQQRF